MTNVVDNRVVELSFDNKQFEAGTKTTMGTLEKLKQALKFDEAAKGFGNLQGAANGLNLSSISSNLDNISSKFSLMGVVGFNVINRLTDAAINFGTKLVEMASGIETIKGGFAEYEQGLQNFQTILANTASAGATVEDVNKAMKDMSDYANQTVYSYGDMSTAMGTFTANGVKLEESVQGIRGLYNLVSMTGGDALKAKSAVWQLSQAISSGTVKLQDWNSVQTAGIGGPDFQNQLIQTAKTHGIMADQIIKDAGSFRESLKEGWLTSQVLMETLGQYGQAFSEQQLKAMGYTDAQIKQITDLGQRAADSATKLKSFTQLVDMLKSNMVTGWATSFKLIIGDLTEAQQLWSEVGNFLGGIMQSSADARNNMLQQWKDLGGRTAIFNSIKNVLTAIQAIIKPISEAFGEIFPPAGGAALASLCKGIERLTSLLIISADTSDKVKMIFKGFLSIFDIIGTLIGTVVGAIGRLIGSLSVKIPGGGILQILSNAASWVVWFRDSIKYGDLLGITFRNILKFLAPMFNWFQAWGNYLGSKISPILQQVGASLSYVMKTFGKFNALVKEGFTPIEAIGEILKFLVPPSLWGAIDKVVTALQSFSNYVSKAGIAFAIFFDYLKLGVAPLDAFGRLLKMLLPPDLSPAIDAIGSGLGNFGGLVKTVAKGIVTALGNIPGAIAGIATKIKNAFSGVGDALSGGLKVDSGGFISGLGKSLIEGFKKINWGGVAAIIAGGLGVSMILSIKKTIDNIGGVFGGVKDTISGVSGILDGVKDSLKAWQQELQAKALTNIAIAIAIMAVSLIALSLVPKEKLSNALSVMTLMFVELVTAMNAFTKNSKGADVAKVGAQLLVLAGAILILSLAITILAKANPDQLQQGLLAVGAALLELAGFMKLISNTKIEPKALVALMGLAVALVILAGAVALFGIMNPKMLAQGLLGVLAVLAELAAFMIATDFAKLFGPSKAIGILILANSLMVLAGVVAMLGLLNPSVLSQGLAAMLAVLAEIAAFMIAAKFGELGPKAAIGILTLVASLSVLAGVVGKFGAMNPTQLAQGLAAMLAVLAEIAAFMIASKFGAMSIQGAASILIMAVAINMLAPALATLGQMKLEQVGIALLAIAGVFTVLGLAGLLLTPVVPVLLLLGAAILMFGIAALAAGVGLLQLSIGLAALVALGYGAIQAINVVFTTIAISLANAMLAFAQTIANNGPAMAAAMGTVLTILFGVIVSKVPEFADATFQLIKGMLVTLTENLPQLLQAGVDLIVALLQGIRDNINRITTAAIEVVLAFIDSVAKKIPDIIQSGVNLLLSFIEGITKAIGDPNNLERLRNASKDLGSAIIKGAIKGLEAGIELIIEAAKSVGEAAIKAIKAILGIKSPSKVFAEIGGQIDQGLANGLIASGYQVEKSAVGVGDRAVKGMRDAIAAISDALNSNMDMNPSIRPVVDLSDVISGGKAIDAVLGSKGISIGATIGKVSGVANGMISSPTQSNNPTVSSATGASIVFNQTNNSPVALSRFEIYRQTKNQLVALKGLVPIE